ncbi:MAG: cytidylate kinase family protein [Treponema sp.]|nr:cytidylate kinase family protein [Treponema sp.]
MAVITVSREMAALGDETAQEMSRLLGYRLVDKDALEARLKTYGVKTHTLRMYDERKPSFFAGPSKDRIEYLHYLRMAFVAELEQGSCVFTRLGANVIFRDMPACVSVFLSARKEIRVARVKSNFDCDEKKAARIVERSDRERAGFHRAFFDMDWRHPENYHLSFNTGIFTPRACAEIVASMKDRFFTPGAETRGRAALKNMALEEKVRHMILYEHGLPIRSLEVSASGGVVALRGAANSQTVLDAALGLAREAAQGSDRRIVVQSEVKIYR